MPQLEGRKKGYSFQAEKFVKTALRWGTKTSRIKLKIETWIKNGG